MRTRRSAKKPPLVVCSPQPVVCSPPPAVESPKKKQSKHTTSKRKQKPSSENDTFIMEQRTKFRRDGYVDLSEKISGVHRGHINYDIIKNQKCNVIPAIFHVPTRMQKKTH